MTEANGSDARAAPGRTAGGVPTQLIILALVAVMVIPGIGFTAFLLNRYAQSERARYEAEGVNVARAAATVIDRQLNGLRSTLQTIGSSAYLSSGDLEGFYEQAQRIKRFVGAEIGLRRADGQQLVNTRVPWGTPLPSTPFAVDAQAIATGQVVITDIFRGALANRPLIAVVAPIEVKGDPNYLLHISIDTERFHETVKAVVPEGWLVGVGDRNGVFVTRTENHGEFSGKPGVPAFLARANRDEGTFVGESAFGQRVFVGYTHTALSNWLVAANVTLATLQAPLERALTTLAAFGVLALVATALVALWLWRFVARPLQGLANASRRIGATAEPIAVDTSLREFVTLRDALSESSIAVHSHQADLEQRVAERTEALERANAELTAQMLAREKAENQVRQLQKMEAVGQLTGGIAHDFNNMLAVVISSLDLLQRRVARGDHDVQRFVDSALDGANRAAALTGRLLAFSRQQPLAPEPLDLNRLVAGMSELLRRTLGEGIRIETVLAGGLWATHADRSQVENAIVNLAVNARDAMPEGGRLTIESANASLDDGYADAHGGIAAGQFVLLAVTDTGVGMAPDVLERAFDPFFTTKGVGMGTGLGLSQVYGFVRQSKGHVKIYSEPGHGTTIKLYLPRHYGDAPARPGRGEISRLPAGAAQETILVVEDEDRLRHLTADTLRELGYSVLQADGAREALRLLGIHPHITLMFTDIVMPEVNGRKLAEQALTLRPDLRVLYTTGFTRNAVIHNGILDNGIDFIAKPFSMEDLAAKVRQVLDRRPAQPG